MAHELKADNVLERIAHLTDRLDEIEKVKLAAMLLNDLVNVPDLVQFKAFFDELDDAVHSELIIRAMDETQRD